jgi:predicted enzyme related to lactoylglutathione lyase
MPEVTSYAPGTPSWVDLATSDPPGARDFYGGLFGWEFDIGGPETGNYTFCRLRGRNVSGMAGTPTTEFPTAWVTYIATDDSETVAKRIEELGGALMMGPMDIHGLGRLVVATDTTGAVFGTWEAGEHIGAGLAREPGTVVWNELTTRDLGAAQRFYQGVFGYGVDDLDTGEGGPAYRTLQVGDETVAGMLQMTEDFGAMPAHWMTYFEVDGTDAAVERAQGLGGTLAVPAFDSLYGRIAVLQDPQGGVFSVMTSTPQ